MRVMPPLLAFNEDLFRDVLRAFDNLDERANEKANEFFNNYPGNEYTDPGDVADWANDHSLAWWQTMVSLRQSMVNLLAAGLYHLIEQQLGVLSLDCAYERVRDTKLDVVKTWYMTNLGIDLSSLEPWAKIHELRLIANSVKHAEGGSAKQLRELRPDLFQNPAFAHIRAEMGASWFDRQEPLAMPLAGEDLFVTEDDLRNYSVAAVALFEGIVEFCEARRDDRFPLNH
ncbi:MAG: hypothetical protein LAP39_27695 [Acidobacteriia bacterium]|nr:hypothetical protein [Terriglobia bacterium]